MAEPESEHNQIFRDHADFINADDNLRKSFIVFIRKLTGLRKPAGKIYRLEIEPFVLDFQRSTCPPDREAHDFLTEKLRDTKSGNNPSFLTPLLAWAWHSKRKTADGADIYDFYSRNGLHVSLGVRKLVYRGEPGEWAIERQEIVPSERRPISSSIARIRESQDDLKRQNTASVLSNIHHQITEKAFDWEVAHEASIILAQEGDIEGGRKCFMASAERLRDIIQVYRSYQSYFSESAVEEINFLLEKAEGKEDGLQQVFEAIQAIHRDIEASLSNNMFRKLP